MHATHCAPPLRRYSLFRFFIFPLQIDYDAVCPLCCEELDVSDRSFYPCKCGYQVCMWCWHRIRESESGLCPACRTPYGEDPHQFSAMDVEEVLKANKEKEAAAKRDRLRQQDNSGNLGAGAASLTGSSDVNSSGNATAEIPKDRSSLGNMRVIRRNLVYAVGLPPHAATEEVLRRPEYFGQYGKIAKIVTNRSHPGSAGEARRASASAYVTFVHKEDTLSCILALDGFYLDGRNIRASYGTSKYCSAFIKNVRCNNPECTYLHELGAAEDTFTKQEIQAGYVTSGRDVLARQQQLVAEQVRLGQAGSLPRKRVGGGGPSGTGRVATSPVFPPPEYDEPSKPAPALVPPPTGVARAVTSTASLNPTNIAAKLGRSSSVGVATPSVAAPSNSPTLGSALVPALAPHRKSHSGPLTAVVPQPAGAPTTAASVVVAGRAGSKAEVESHATLTPLTPLKRSTGKTTSARASSVAGSSTQPTAPATTEAEGKLTPLRNGTNKKPINGVMRSASVGVSPSAPVLPSAQQLQHSASSGPSLIGGGVIGPPTLKPRSASLIADLGGDPIDPQAVAAIRSPSSFGSIPIGACDPNGDTPALSSALGGEVFTGELPNWSKSAIGSSSHKWGNVGQVGETIPSAPSQYNGVAFASAPPGPSLLHDSHRILEDSGKSTVGPAIGGSVIGGSREYSSSGNGNSSSALASILGISLPTGSGSLQETRNLWHSGSSGAPEPSPAPSPLSTLNGSALPSQDAFGGRPASAPGSSLIGGVPIGVPSRGGMSDLSLLQSLLPDVHITSGSDSVGFSGAGAGGAIGGRVVGVGGWSGAPSGPSAPHGMSSTGLHGGAAPGSWNGASGIAHPMAGHPIGAIGSNMEGHQGDQRRGPGIW